MWLKTKNYLYKNFKHMSKSIFLMGVQFLILTGEPGRTPYDTVIDRHCRRISQPAKKNPFTLDKID
jgi:hypothetical protein